MIRKALEKVMSEDMSEIWTVLNNEEKRRIIDAFVIHNYKKNQMIYAEGEEPEYLWCLLQGRGTLSMTLVKDMINNNRRLAWFFIHELSRNLGGSDTKIVNLTQKHIRGRLAEALIVLSDHYGYEDDNMTLKIYMAREDLANLSNMTTSNAIRTLSGFVSEKLITVDGRRIRILDEPQLRKISKYG